MDESTRQTIAKLQGRVRKHEEDARGIKRTINTLLEMEGEPPAYGVAELGGSDQTIGTIRPDSFYGQALNTSIRRILEMRKAVDSGPATVREIFESLTMGGFQFDTKNAENAMRNLRISLSKSTTTFHRLPNGSYGLAEWYPDLKLKKPKERPGEAEGEAQDAQDDPSSEEAEDES